MKYGFVVIMCLLAIAGCGGGGSHPLNISGYNDLSLTDGVNQDDSLYDYALFTTTRAGWVQVTMDSTAFDPYLIVYRGTTETTEVGHDDDSGSNTNAVFFFHANAGETYTVKFTSYGAGAKLGNYSFTIKEVTGPIALNMVKPLAEGKTPQDPAMKRAK
jgi:hypothetical protein